MEKEIDSNVDNFDLLKTIPQLKDLFNKYPMVFDYSKHLKGLPRHVGQHPAGICVAPFDVTNVVPVLYAKETTTNKEPGFMAQFDKDNVESSGLNFWTL